MIPQRTLLAAALAAALIGLAACGDNPAEAPPAPPQASDEVPASAMASTSAWTQYAASLAANDTEQPKKLSDAAAPTSETAEPLPL
jgi:predicted small lipoprotein YifL